MAGEASRPTEAGAAKGRLLGACVGAIIGAGWAAYGLWLLPVTWRLLGTAIGVVILYRLLAKGRSLALGTVHMPMARDRRQWRWFMLIVVGEIVLLNVAVALLARPDLHVYWTAAISLVVGLHFLPMAPLFDYPSFMSCGVAIIAGAALAALAIHGGAAGAAIPAEALLNALILWATAAQGLRLAAARLRES